MQGIASNASAGITAPVRSKVFVVILGDMVTAVRRWEGSPQSGRCRPVAAMSSRWLNCDAMEQQLLINPLCLG
jgi:hypothetical protein